MCQWGANRNSWVGYRMSQSPTHTYPNRGVTKAAVRLVGTAEAIFQLRKIDMCKNLQQLCFCQQRFEGNYGAFVTVINTCLCEERLLIESAFDPGDVSFFSFKIGQSQF